MNSLFWPRSFCFCAALVTMLVGGERTLSAATAITITNQPQDQVVTELLSATFVVGASGSPIPQYQWYKNGIAISNATSKTLTLFPVQLTDNGTLFQAVVFNILTNTIFSSATSSVAMLTVLPDTTPPALVSASGLYPALVYVLFSEGVRIDTATNLANYSITSANGSLGLSNATLLAGSTTVALTTAPQAAGTVYTLTVNGVVDLAVAANMVAPNSQATFTPADYSGQPIGNPALGGSVTVVSNGYDILAGGADIGGARDQFLFGYQTMSGDFDVKVRLQGLSLSDTWAKAGLMARTGLATSNAFAAALATPTLAGCFFESRSTTGGQVSTTGSFPINYPYTWLRLQRQSGTIFNGYAGVDGQSWVPVGSVTINSATGAVYFGLAATGHTNDPAQGTLAQFRDVGSAAGGVAVSHVNFPFEPPGPSSRRAPIAITEIMYQPAPQPDGSDLEFVELYNSNPFYEDIGGYSLSGNIAFTFPSPTIIQGGSYLVVARVPADVQSHYGISGVLGYGLTNTLSNFGAPLRLLNKEQAVLLEIPYSPLSPWPVAANGTGHSLFLARPSYGEGFPQGWAISESVDGTPGRGEAFRANPLRAVVINEFLAHSESSAVPDYIELYNHSAQPVDVSGCVLSDNPLLNKFVIPPGTILPAAGFIAFDQHQLGFVLNGAGGAIFFKSADLSRTVDALTYEPQADGISSGRYPDGGPSFYPLTTRTPGAANSGILIRDVVINEIMYSPISGDNNDQYLELYNKGTNVLDLTNWKFTAGPKFTFPTNTLLAPDSYLVVAKNTLNLFTHYPNLNADNTLGNFNGKMPHGGRIALAMPQLLVTNNNLGQRVTNTIYVVEDEVTFGTGGRWAQWAKGGGSSLELVDPRADHRLAYNWADSDETTKAPWTDIEHTGFVDPSLGASQSGSIGRLEVGLLGAGECLVDNVEVFVVGNTNLIGNSTFESGLAPWYVQGTHVRSTLETNGVFGLSGYNSSQSLHVRASDTCDEGANRIRCALTRIINPGQTVTIRLKVRWLRGWPELIARLQGNYLEATGRFALPANLGTPGARNSQAAPNAGPAIYAVTHSPPMPAANEPVVVTARAHDVDGLSAVTLNYRLDSLTANHISPAGQLSYNLPTYTSVMMNDAGTNGDAIAGDGVYSATIPGQPAAALVCFYVQANDNSITPATTSFPKVIPEDECLVRFGEPTPPTGFGVYHLWFSRNNSNHWTTLPDLSNEKTDLTWVYANSRIIYNVKGKYANSPYHQIFTDPVTSPCHYGGDFPEDDLFMGGNSFTKLHCPGNGPGDDDTMQREQALYWMARQMGLPWNYRRFVAVYVNGFRKVGQNSVVVLMEDSQTPDGAVVNEHFPNDNNGQLFKLQPWFEFDDLTGQSGGFNNNEWCTLLKYQSPSGGPYFLPRYRWKYLTRAANTTANDYTNVFKLIDAAYTPPGSAYTAAMDALVDSEQWMRTFAVHHSVGDWDHFGSQNAQNMYAYLPTKGKWTLFLWDCNIVIGNSGSWSPGQNLFVVAGGDTQMTQFYQNPPFRRAYWRGLRDVVTGPMNLANVGPLVNSRYAAFIANGYNPGGPSEITGFLSSAITSILSQMSSAGATAPFALNGANNFTTDNDLITLRGTAPINVKNILVSINGNTYSYPVTWVITNATVSDTTPISSWSVRLTASPGTNQITLQGYDRLGNLMSNIAQTVTVNYTGAAPSPQGLVAINEIMYHPVTPGAGYIEIYNAATNYSFDLSNWRLDGVGFTFPLGTILTNGQFMIVAESAAAIPTGVAVGGFYNQPLDPNGETIALVKPGPTPAQDLVISKVHYENIPPWPVRADGLGASLQLIDPTQDESRVSEWSDGVVWRHFSFTGVPATNLLFMYLNSIADVYLDDIFLVQGAVPEFGPNLLQDGDFESPLSGPWMLGTNYLGSSISTDVSHSGSGSLHLIGSASGGQVARLSLSQQAAPLVPGTNYTMSFWYLPTGTGSNLLTYMGSAFRPSVSLRVPTPGVANSVAGGLPPYDPLWLNELQAENVGGPVDGMGEHDPWLELYNAGANVVSLNGYYLSDNYSNLTEWAFPPGATINPHQFLVIWADGEPGQGTATELHTSFRLAAGTGSLALSRLVNGQAQIVDYLNYTGLPPDQSYGDYPDGQPFDRAVFRVVTPGAANHAPPLSVWINEWMAANANTLTDPRSTNTDQSEDWFELYNASNIPADLSGYYLGHTLTKPLQFQIPAGYVIAPHGFLLVWADGQPNLNNPSDPALHINFNLKKSGTSFGLFAASGTPVDTVTFGQQISDVSQGRYPDGAATISFLASATPAGPNSPPGNLPPALAAIPNKTVYPGQTLSFTASATDPDLPPETLTFSLDNPSPSGAMINPFTGLFSWTPSAAQGGSTNMITVRVTDSGTPNLSATRAFRISVLPAPQITGISHTSGGMISISLQTVVGKTYRLEYKDHLSDPAWTSLGDFPATSGSLTINDNPGAAGQRFYRIEQVN